MRLSQILKDLQEGKANGKEFIKWWRKENDFTDYELIDRFLTNADSQHEIESFALLDKDEMWDQLKRWKPVGLRRSKSTRSEQIEWQHRTKEGKLHTYTCPYTAQSIMSIFDAETKGDTVG